MRLLPYSDNVFYQDYTHLSSSDIAGDGGTLADSPALNRDGLTLNGSSQYVSYDIPNTLLSSPKLSICIEFTPDFNWNDGVTHYLMDATAGQRVVIYKTSGQVLSLYLKVGTIISSAGTTYGPYWKAGGRNVIVCTCSSGSNYMYLNGNQVGYSATTFTSLAPTELYVGANLASAQKFAGIIKSVSFHNRILTSTEATHLFNNSLFNFINKCSLYHDFVSVSDSVADDLSRFGYDTTIDGCTFLAPGISFDGVDDRIVPSIADPSGSYTVIYRERNTGLAYNHSSLTAWNTFKTSGGFSGILDYLAVFPFVLTPVQIEFLAAGWKATPPF